jgi:hypothetical protein
MEIDRYRLNAVGLVAVGISLASNLFGVAAGAALLWRYWG